MPDFFAETGGGSVSELIGVLHAGCEGGCEDGGGGGDGGGGKELTAAR